MPIVKRIASEEYATEKASYEANKAVENVPQSDWNQGDETASDFIKNRTHHEDIVTTSTVLIDEEVSLVMAPDVSPEAAWSEPIALENGKTYTVTVNDAKQELVCENDELIFVDAPDSGDTLTIKSEVIYGSSEYTYRIKIEITEVSTTIKQLDEKFIPDTIARVSDIPTTAIKPFPYYAVDNSNAYITKYKVNLEELEDGVLYSVQESAPTKYTAFQMTIVCDDGTEKPVTNITDRGNIVFISQNGTKIRLHDYFSDSGYAVDISDKSTANNVVVEYNPIAKWLPTNNTSKYTPTRDYHPATKKYVDDSLSDKKNKDIVLTLSWTTAEDGTRTYSVDKTFEEIKEAYNSGTSLYINTSGIELTCTKVSNTNAKFGYFSSSNLIEHLVLVNSDNTVTWTSTTRSAKSNIYGGVKADTKSDTDTVPAKIGEDGKLYVPSYPTLDGLASEDYVSDQIDLVEQDIDALSTEIKNLDIPSNVSDLNNDSGFITRTVQNLANYYLKSETYSQDEVNAKLSAIPKFAIQPVDTLPTSNISVTTVYLLKSGEESQNLYTEYIYVNNTWEYLGTQTVDLSGYALKSDVPIKLSELTNDSGFITKNVSDLVNYYKKTEVYSKNEIDAKKYLTEHQDLSAYAKTSQIPTKVSQLTNDSKFLTAIPNEYVTESELEGKGYLTQHQDLSFYAKKSTTLAGYGITDGATKQEVSQVKETIADYETHKSNTSIHVTSAEKQVWNNKQPSGDYALSSELSAEIIARENAIVEAKAQMTQQPMPIFVDSVDECTDTSKLYVINGYIYAYKKSAGGQVASFENLYDAETMATDTYLNKRINSSSAYADANGYISTPYIPITAKAGDTITIRTKGVPKQTTSYGYCRLIIYNVEGSTSNAHGATGNIPNGWTVAEEDNGVYMYSRETSYDITCLRATLYISSSPITASDVADIVITVNEEIVYTTGESYAWVNTGIPYTATLYTDLIGIVDENNVIYLSDNNLPSGTYTLKYGDETYQTIGIITVE